MKYYKKGLNHKGEMRKNTNSPPFRSIQMMYTFFIWFISFKILVQQLPITIISAQPLTQVKVGVVVDDMESSAVGKMAVSCIHMALSDFYATTHGGRYKTRLLLNTRDSKKDVVAAAAAALDLVKNVQVQAILGPSTSMEAKFLIELGQKAAVPIISFSATSPSLTSIRSPYFFQAAQIDSTQVNAISAIVEAFGWREAVPIYIDNEYGQGILPYLTDAFEAVNVKVPYRSTISPLATDDQISQELYKLMTMPTRVFILHMSPFIGFRLLSKAKEIGMMKDGFVWIMTNGITDSLPPSPPYHPSVFDTMQGVLGVRPHVPRTEETQDFRVRWKRKFQQDNPDIVDPELLIYGLWAYDAAIALAMAVEKAGISNFTFQMPNVSGKPSTDLEIFGVSHNGPSLIRALSKISFKGIARDFSFFHGVSQSAFELVNVNGNGARGIGFWTPTSGLVKELELKANTTSTYSTSNSSLAPIIWPGDSTSVPKGWQIPTNGKRFRVGVPVIEDGFDQFVKVTRDPTSNTMRVTGYCIDVFDAVIQALPYSVAYDYVPFANPDGEMAGTYDDLVNQVYLGVYDAVVGDVTILANRSLYVDFTLPYTDSGVSLVVPIVDKQSKNAWVFLTPLTWDLWMTSFCFFIFIGFVVWVLEHRINEDFRGPPLHQAGTSFWFSFSTMMFAHRERVVSNLARAAVMIWCFVVLILTQSYTASLTSLLTVQKLQPSVTEINQLIKNGDHVGYLDGSFVFGNLKDMGFDESKLRVYNSPEECDELFRKGSGNGGIAAAFDEVPYIKVFLGKYCSKYTIVEPTYSTDGFSFVFPKGSPLVSDISRAVLQVREGGKMKQIEDSWFGNQSCPASTSSVSSSSLSLQSFWGLFLIAGVASVLALVTFLGMFLYENWDVLMPPDSQASIWSRIPALLQIFIQKDMEFHTFRKSGSNPPSIGASPTSYSVHTSCPGDSPFAEYGGAHLRRQERAPHEVMQDSRQVFFGKAGDKAPQELAVDINQASSSSQGGITEIDSIDENLNRKEAQEFYFDRPRPKGSVIHTD